MIVVRSEEEADTDEEVGQGQQGEQEDVGTGGAEITGRNDDDRGAGVAVPGAAGSPGGYAPVAT